MISVLVQLQHLFLPSLIVTSSQVRVGMPLPLPLCCIPGLGPKGLGHNRPISSKPSGIFLLRVTLASGETPPPRTFHAKLHGQSAVSTRRPTMPQHPLEKQVTSSRTYKDQNFFGFTSDLFLRRPISIQYWLLRPLFFKEATCKSSTINGLLYAHETLIVARRYDVPWD